MKNAFLIITLAFVSIASSQAYAQSFNIEGDYTRDDYKPRKIEHVENGINMTTEEQVYFYRKIGENKYQMDWTKSEYGGTYRWTMTVLNENKFKNLFEKSTGTYTRWRNYTRADDTTRDKYLSDNPTF